jgi:parallel beta-helix repeat protein
MPFLESFFMRRMLACLVGAGVFCLVAAAVSAQDQAELPKPVGNGKAWWVAENGNDGGAGSKAKPWKTIARAGRTVRPGDVVYVQPGHYEGAILKTAGTKKAPITYISVERHKAIIDLGGFQPSKGTNGHRVEVDGSYSIFDGFACSTGWDPTKTDDRIEVSKGAPAAGIATYHTTGVIFRNNDCFDNDRWGIFTKRVKDMVIENNIVRNSRREHGIYHADGSTNSILRNNTSFGNGACGIQLNEGGQDPYVNVVIEGNLLYDNNHAGGQSMNLDGVTDTTIRNNIFIVSRRNGIALYQGDGSEAPRDNVIVNNLFLLEDGCKGGILTNNCSTNWIFNNLFWSVGKAPAFNDEGSTLNKQMVGSNACNLPIAGENNVILSCKLEDLFENPADKIFKLKSGAPVIDRGTAEFEGKRAPETDRDGLKRPQGAGIDIGPYEAKAE